ncbi:N-acetyltransferase [Bradyrhizobium sp. SSBR45G]|uniref:GNAT family N-acetyltransferase n=1 Tax=unclassified Bradyrhizobium TaxID=2631580 RepID=UPI002342BD21|nr:MULTISPECIES: GNAT family N-acetyltransferase [unclassified Bradyrhizobium]GLH80398.1 N-acetyltransferase [Bradyrhizobium sp. SSBR45G]GLH84766.1 N-acetyltransferase [Bradyrhizobium sp. SSBR45R]
MPTPAIADLAAGSSIIHTRRGEEVRLHFVTSDDAEALQAYVRSLSQRSRTKRFLGALSELPKAVLDDFVSLGRNDRYSLIGTMELGGIACVVAEARYALDRASGRVEFGLSVHDRWHGHGIGPALIAHLEGRALALGGVSLSGDALRTNDVMIALARKAGFTIQPHADDWTLVRFEKVLTGRVAQPSSTGLQVVGR